MEKIGYVYLTTNLVNGKQYVGQHLHDDFDVKYKGSGHYIKKAFDKYGWDNFDCKVICWCATQTQLNEAEDNYIKLLDTMVPNGYNLKGGGANGRFSDEARKNCSEAHKGFKHTEESRQKMSEVQKGHITSTETREKIASTLKGKEFTNERKKKISVSLLGNTPWNKGKIGIYTEESLQKMSKAKINNPDISKKVYQYRKDGTFVREYLSASEAMRITDIGHIIECCNGKRKSAGGCLWAYEPLH